MSPEQQLPLAARKDSALGTEISEISPEWQYSVLSKDTIDNLGPGGLPGQIENWAKKGVELEVVGDAAPGSDVCVRMRTLPFLDVSRSANRPKNSEVEKTSLTMTQRYAALEVEDLPNLARRPRSCRRARSGTSGGGPQRRLTRSRPASRMRQSPRLRRPLRRSSRLPQSLPIWSAGDAICNSWLHLCSGSWLWASHFLRRKGKRIAP